MKLDDHHREGRDAAARRNRIDLRLEAEKPRAIWDTLLPFVTSRWTVWALVIAGLLGLALNLPLHR